jgi:hypothetical protein
MPFGTWLLLRLFCPQLLCSSALCHAMHMQPAILCCSFLFYGVHSVLSSWPLSLSSQKVAGSSSCRSGQCCSRSAFLAYGPPALTLRSGGRRTIKPRYALSFVVRAHVHASARRVPGHARLGCLRHPGSMALAIGGRISSSSEQHSGTCSRLRRPPLVRAGLLRHRSRHVGSLGAPETIGGRRSVSLQPQSNVRLGRTHLARLGARIRLVGAIRLRPGGRVGVPSACDLRRGALALSHARARVARVRKPCSTVARASDAP